MASLVMDINFQHKHRRHIAAVVAALFSIALGLALAARVANETSGYVAGYTWFILLMLIGLIVIILLILSLILVFQRKTRWMSLVLVASSVLLAASYLMSVKTFEKVGWSRYAHEQMVKFGPDVQSSPVIFYKKGTTDEQIESFLQERLSRPHPEGRGYYLIDGTQSRLRLLPIQGYEATAITLRPDVTQEQRDKIMAEITSSPIIYKVMENVVLSEIKAIDDTPPSNNSFNPTPR